MQELLAMIISEAKSALRFRWYGMAAAWAIGLLGLTWLVLQPDVYEARARVFVDTSSVLEPILGNQIVSADVETQLAYLREALLGQEELSTVARDLGLDAKAETPERQANVVRALRDAIDIETTGRTRTMPDNIYVITYRHENRDTAVGVVDSLLNTFVEDALGENRRGGDTAERFLEERVREYEARLEQADQALAAFKKEHADRLPGAEGTYFDRMQAERDALALANRDLRLLQSRRAQLQQQLNGEAPVVAGAAIEPAPNSLDARIRDYQTQLDAALLQYTDKHPDVIALRETLARLLAQRDEQLAAFGVQGPNQELSGLDANPVYQQLSISLNQTDVEIATLQTDVRDREVKVAELQGLIDEVPEVEAQLARLNRDYEVIHEQYLQLVRSRETQELTRKASNTDQIDFRIIDSPFASFAPVAPNRLALLAGVMVASLVAAGGLCYVLAQLWPVFSTTRSLRDFIEYPVLGAVTHAWEDRLRIERRKAMVAYVGVLASLFVVFAGLAGIELVGPGMTAFSRMSIS